MAVERIRKGDKVRAEDGSGPVMDVLAVSSHLAICAWQDAGQGREAVLELQGLRRVAAQQQQQVQPDAPPVQTPPQAPGASQASIPSQAPAASAAPQVQPLPDATPGPDEPRSAPPRQD